MKAKIVTSEQFLKGVGNCYWCGGRRKTHEFEVGGHTYWLCSKCLKNKEVKFFFLKRYGTNIENLFVK